MTRYLQDKARNPIVAAIDNQIIGIRFLGKLELSRQITDSRNGYKGGYFVSEGSNGKLIIR